MQYMGGKALYPHAGCEQGQPIQGNRKALYLHIKEAKQWKINIRLQI